MGTLAATPAHRGSVARPPRRHAPQGRYERTHATASPSGPLVQARTGARTLPSCQRRDAQEGSGCGDGSKAAWSLRTPGSTTPPRCSRSSVRGVSTGGGLRPSCGAGAMASAKHLRRLATRECPSLSRAVGRPVRPVSNHDLATPVQRVWRWHGCARSGVIAVSPRLRLHLRHPRARREERTHDADSPGEHDPQHPSTPAIRVNRSLTIGKPCEQRP